MEKVMQITKTEIERAIAGKDDFVKIDYLNRYLKQVDNFEIKKFILMNLSSINESKNMLPAAIANITSAADMTLTYKEKIGLWIKIAELYIKMRNFQMAENSLKQALYFAPELEKLRLKEKYIELHKKVADEFETKGKSRQSLEIYEHMLSLNQPEEKKAEIKQKLLDYYNKRGMILEYNKLKNAR